MKQLKKLDHTTQKRIDRFIKTRLEVCDDPRSFGKGLTGNLSRYWRYRVEKYRIICEIRDHELIIQLITIGKRDTIYD